MNNITLEIRSLREYPERADECGKLLLAHFSESVKNHPYQTIDSDKPFPQGYFLLKNDAVVGWAGLRDDEPVLRNDLSPWISPLLIHPEERGNRYGKMLLDHVCVEAGKLGFGKVYLTTDHIGYYEKVGFREIGLTNFTWGRPSKIYERETEIT